MRGREPIAVQGQHQPEGSTTRRAGELVCTRKLREPGILAVLAVLRSARVAPRRLPTSTTLGSRIQLEPTTLC